MKYQKIIGIICLLALSFLLIDNFYSKYVINNKIENEGIVSICKVYKYSAHKKYQNYYYYYYYKGNRIENFEDVNSPRLGDNSTNKFYRVKYLKDNPEISKIYLDKEVLDTNLILENGFNSKYLEDVIHEVNTNSYKKIKKRIIY